MRDMSVLGLKPPAVTAEMGEGKVGQFPRLDPIKLGDIIYHGTSTTFKQQNVRRWLLGWKKEITDEMIHVVSRCESGAEVFFGLPFAELPDVKPVDGSFVGPTIRLTPQVRIANHKADYVAQCGRFRLAIEIDGHEWHQRSEQQVQADYLRQRRLVLCGYPVIRFTAMQVFTQQAECWRQTQAILEANG